MISSDEESAVLLELFTTQKHKYSKAEPAAKELLAIGSSKRDESIPLADAAAWTQVARAILNPVRIPRRNHFPRRRPGLGLSAGYLP